MMIFMMSLVMNRAMLIKTMTPIIAFAPSTDSHHGRVVDDIHVSFGHEQGHVDQDQQHGPVQHTYIDNIPDHFSFELNKKTLS